MVERFEGGIRTARQGFDGEVPERIRQQAALEDPSAERWRRSIKVSDGQQATWRPHG